MSVASVIGLRPLLKASFRPLISEVAPAIRSTRDLLSEMNQYRYASDSQMPTSVKPRFSISVKHSKMTRGIVPGGTSDSPVSRRKRNCSSTPNTVEYVLAVIKTEHRLTYLLGDLSLESTYPCHPLARLAYSPRRSSVFSPPNWLSSL